MKLTVFLILLGLLRVSAVTNAQVYRINLELENVACEEAIESVKRQTNLDFFFSNQELNVKRKVSVSCKNASLEEALKQILGEGYGFRLIDNTVVIRPVKDQFPQSKQVTVKGTVRDVKGNPLPGVTVLLKGTALGVSTDGDGKFAVSFPEMKDAVLLFSFIGMRSQEVKYTGQTDIKVVLEEDATEMEEVVVTGYQTLRKRDVTGSVTTVKASDVMMPAYTSIDQMLQGRVAGLMVMNTSSRVGTSPQIRIRGTSTILGNRDPLWVVDGIIQPDPLPLDQNDAMVDDLKNIIGNQISWLNPSDIETITVLKDASATAIYGSKAANGVIVITTKRGKSDHITVSYSGNFSLRTRPKYDQFNYMDSRERIQFSREAFEYGAAYSSVPEETMDSYEGIMRLYMDRKITKEVAERQIQKLESANTNWLKMLTRNSFSHNHNLSLSGGSDKITYNASIAYGDNSGVELGNDASNWSGRLRLGIQLHPKVHVDASLGGSINKNTGYAADVNPLDYATKTSRSVPGWNEDGSRHFLKKRTYYSLNPDELYLDYNILNELENSYSKSRSTRMDGTLNFKWEILPWLSYEFTGGVNENTNLSESYAGENTYFIASKYRGYDVGGAANGSDLFEAAMLPFGGKLHNVGMGTSGWNIQNKVLFSKTFDEIHRLNAIIGTEVSSALTQKSSSTIWGYVPERGESVVQPTPIEDLKPIGNRYLEDEWGILGELYNGGWSHSTQTTRTFSLFATLAYSLKDRYVFNASVRNDVSNRFGQDQNKRFDPTYSFGLSWDVAAEKWMEGTSGILNQLNFRATFGIQGNSLSSVSPDVILRENGVKKPYNEFGVTLVSIPNPNLSWERTKSWNFGLDIQMFKWFSMNLEYYGKRSNVIINQEISVEYGLRSMKINGGRVTNEGVEYTLNMTPVLTKDWAWTIGLNSSKNWNEMKNAPIDEITLSSYLNGRSDRVLKKGYPLSAFWSYSYKGLNPETGFPEFNLLDTEEFSGDFSDLLVYSGQSEPDFTGGLNTRLRWKGLTLGMDFAVILGSKKRLPNPYPNGGFIPDSQSNLDKDLLKSWKKPGDEKFTDFPSLYKAGSRCDIKVPEIGTLDGIEVWSQSDFRVVNASFLRCRQMSLSWRVQSEWCKKFGVQDLTLNATLNNVFVVCSKKFNGFDPELGNSVQPKIFSFGVNISL